jgi:hypothetical protein
MEHQDLNQEDTLLVVEEEVLGGIQEDLVVMVAEVLVDLVQ